MKRSKSLFESKEPLLEKLLQTIRFKKVEPFIKNGSKLLDLGCGYKGAFLKKEYSKISEGRGCDISVTKKKLPGNIKLIPKDLDGNLRLPQNHFDVVISLAVIEHLINPGALINQAYKTLKKGGLLILETPTPKAQTLLELLAYKIHVVSEQEIRDHKNYYSGNDLLKMLERSGFKKGGIKIKPFELGFNLFVTAKK